EVFRCADGGRIVLAVGSDAQFGKLCEVLGLASIKADGRYATNRQRVVHRTELAGELGRAIGRKQRDGLLTELKQAGVPAGAVNTLDQALASPTAQRMLLKE